MRRWTTRAALVILAIAAMAASKGSCDPDPIDPIGCQSDSDCTDGAYGQCELDTGECRYGEPPVYGPVENEDALRSRIDRVAGQTLSQYDVQHIDVPALLQRLDRGDSVALPIVAQNGRLAEIDVRGDRVDVLAPQVEAFFAKGPQQPRQLQATRPLQYRLGCSAPERYCGVLTVLDGQQTQAEIAIYDDVHGFVFLESAQSLLTYAEEARPQGVEPSAFVSYNAIHHATVDINCTLGIDREILVDLLDFTVVAEIPIVLDADARFYSLDTSTVWARQESILGSMNLIYGWLEPLTTDVFDITFTIKGQEAWLPGYGPTTTNGDDLEVEINDPGYYMINHPANDELSLYFAADDMNGSLVGKAGGICNDPCCGQTFGSAAAHQQNHAWAQQVQDSNGSFDLSSLYARIVVSAHETGHMIGMRHGDGDVNGCGGGGGIFDTWCGPTIGLAGNGGQPGDRVPFFSTKNRQNIATCVDDALNP